MKIKTFTYSLMAEVNSGTTFALRTNQKEKLIKNYLQINQANQKKKH